MHALHTCSCVRPTVPVRACILACVHEPVSHFPSENNRAQKRMGGSPVPLNERQHWLYVNFAARNESLRQVLVCD